MNQSEYLWGSLRTAAAKTPISEVGCKGAEGLTELFIVVEKVTDCS